MTSISKRKEESHLVNGGVKQSTWSKAFNSNAVWEEKVSQFVLFCYVSALVVSRFKVVKACNVAAMQVWLRRINLG